MEIIAFSLASAACAWMATGSPWAVPAVIFALLAIVGIVELRGEVRGK